MKVEFDFSLDDLVEVTLCSIKDDSWLRKARLQSAIFSGLLFGLLGYVILPFSREFKIIIGITLSLLAALIGLAKYESGQKKRLRKALKEKISSEGPFHCLVEITESEFAISQLGETIIRKWEEIKEVIDDNDGVLVQTRNDSITVIRNRAFPTQETRLQFIELATHYMNQSKNSVKTI